MNENERMASEGDVIEKAYKAYFRDVYKFVFRRIQNRQIAEDIVHDVFCAALNKGEEFRKHPAQKRWLMVCARNKIYELYRKMRHRASESLEDIKGMEAEENDYEKIELELTALAIINEEEWELVKDFYLTGTTIEELAEKYGITKNNMRVRLFRLRAKLRNGIDR